MRRDIKPTNAPRRSAEQDDSRSCIEPVVPLRRVSAASLDNERTHVWAGTPTQEVTGMLMSGDGRTVRYLMARRAS